LNPPVVMQGHVPAARLEAAAARDSVFAEEDFEGNVLQAIRSKTWKLITANPATRAGSRRRSSTTSPRTVARRRTSPTEKATEREEMRALLGRAIIKAKEHAGRARKPTSTAPPRNG
jgi:hypothetical protein